MFVALALAVVFGLVAVPNFAGQPGQPRHHPAPGGGPWDRGAGADLRHPDGRYRPVGRHAHGARHRPEQRHHGWRPCPRSRSSSCWRSLSASWSASPTASASSSPGEPADRDACHDVDLQGAIFLYTDRTVGSAPSEFRQLATATSAVSDVDRPAGHPGAACWVVLRHTPLGRYIYAVGSDADSARRAGIPVGRVTAAAYVICGSLAAVAGLVLAARLGSGYTGAGAGFELDSIVAVVLGGTATAGRPRWRAGREFAGVLLLALIANMLNLLGISPFTQRVVNGIIHHRRHRHLHRTPTRSMTGVGRGPGGFACVAGRSLIGLWLALAGDHPRGRLVLAFGFIEPINFFNMLRQASVVGIAAVGVTLVMITGRVDLSVGAIISFASVLAASLMDGVAANIPLAVAATVAMGALVGLANGLLVGRWNLPSFSPHPGHGHGGAGGRQLYTGGTAAGVVAPESGRS